MGTVVVSRRRASLSLSLLKIRHTSNRWDAGRVHSIKKQQDEDEEEEEESQLPVVNDSLTRPTEKDAHTQSHPSRNSAGAGNESKTSPNFFF